MRFRSIILSEECNSKPNTISTYGLKFNAVVKCSACDSLEPQGGYDITLIYSLDERETS